MRAVATFYQLIFVVVVLVVWLVYSHFAQSNDSPPSIDNIEAEQVNQSTNN